MEKNLKIQIFPLTNQRWADFETVMGKSGCGGCWCAWWRLTHKDFYAINKEERKSYMRTIVQEGVEPGLIAYVDEEPAGWATVAPREDYVRLKTSRILAPVDDEQVWCLPCFFIRSKFRHMGLMSKLIDTALEYARAHGARILEAYPNDPEKEANPLSIYTGVASTFLAAGFEEVARRKPNRPVMRKNI